MGAIVVSGVSKTYRGGIVALADVSLEVAPGEIYGLLGRNGAGKTTLIKILLDLVRATGGEASLLGVPTRRPAARAAVGYLPEDHRLPEYHTAASALRFYGGLAGLSGSRLRRRIGETLQQFGLADAARRRIRAFSKGMKQRLGLAQALLTEPQILFLDEPTDGVDPVGRAQIRGALETLKRQGRTIFLNSHLLSEVEQLCDRVGILERGRLVRTGTIPELTQVSHVFNVTCAEAPPAPVLEELRGCAVAVRANGAELEISLAGDDGIDAVVDLLRARGVRLRALAGKRESLEDVFLRSVQEGAGEAAP